MTSSNPELGVHQAIEVPEGWPGTDGEYVAFSALTRAGKEPGRDFSFRSSMQGRRLETDVEVNFIFHDPPDLAFQVQESFYNHHSGLETRGRDILARAQLAGSGVRLIFLDYDKLTQDPDWLIEEALRYHDHSWG